MNRLLIPLLILLGSLLFCWHWACNRADHCSGDASVAVAADTTVVEAAPAPDTAIAADTAGLQLSAEEQILLEPLDVYFAVNKSGINRDAKINEWLDKAKKYLEKHPEQKLTVTGHTDSDGDDASNQALSERRAGQVKDLLVKEGFMAGNLDTAGKGESEPIADNGTPEGKQQNRRVNIRLVN
jgi:outer membrane protein OmpA-like peptidoglycan-associated protein